ncbi:hypothetical protein BDF21DRAFT_496145 [Thamnidium elegans]|nr:hypothetical protein BDF21DRAFT_496145 [Thamnidium elegans]
MNQTEIDRIDYKYCAGPCRFLSLYRIPEQETRAQLHVRHFAYTAGLLNRTLILPNVGNSRIGSCLAHDFEYYYDIQWAKDNSDSFQYITMSNFLAWLKERKQYGVPAMDQMMSLYDVHHDPHPEPTDKYANCFQDYTVPKSIFNRVIAWDTKSGHFHKTGESEVIKFVRGDAIEGTSSFEYDDTEVIHVDIKRGDPFSLNTEAKRRINYNSELVKLADQTASDLGPYVAVHWRMETVGKTEKLIDCAKGLVATLQHDVRYQNLSVFLLTDYPHSFSLQQQQLAIDDKATAEELDQWLHSTSDTFHQVYFNTYHHRAIQLLYRNHAFTLFETKVGQLKEKIENWNVLPIPEQLHASVDEVGLIDSGWLGILDKLTAIRSSYFISGQPLECARRSTFTAQIRAERDLRMGYGQGAEYFGFRKNSTTTF